MASLIRTPALHEVQYLTVHLNNLDFFEMWKINLQQNAIKYDKYDSSSLKNKTIVVFLYYTKTL